MTDFPRTAHRLINQRPTKQPLRLAILQCRQVQGYDGPSPEATDGLLSDQALPQLPGLPRASQVPGVSFPITLHPRPMPQRSPPSTLAFPEDQGRQQPERPRLRPSESSQPSGAAAVCLHRRILSILARPRNRPVMADSHDSSPPTPSTRALLRRTCSSDFAARSVRLGHDACSEGDALIRRA